MKESDQKAVLFFCMQIFREEILGRRAEKSREKGKNERKLHFFYKKVVYTEKF
jgi:hypothetical protein